jgi:hypothetical protein
MKVWRSFPNSPALDLDSPRYIYTMTNIGWIGAISLT